MTGACRSRKSTARGPWKWALVGALAVLPGLSGCATKLGSRSLPEVRRSYNEAVAESADQQMLLNIVRLRHLHTTAFMQLGSVVTQYELSQTAGINGSGNIGPGASPRGSSGGSVGVTNSEKPTVTYLPLEGEDFVRRMATPLSASSVALLIHAGWSWDVVFSCCVLQVNDTFAAALPTAGDDDRFDRLGTLMGELQRRHELDVVLQTDDDAALEPSLYFRTDAAGRYSREASEVRVILGLEAGPQDIPLSDRVIHRPPGVVAIRGRSLLDAMLYLSQGVEVPDDDAAVYSLEGRGVTAQAWLEVKYSKRPPRTAYVTVPYDDLWYYIDDRDQRSKRVFALLRFLFAFMSSSESAGPALTVSAG